MHLVHEARLQVRLLVGDVDGGPRRRPAQSRSTRPARPRATPAEVKEALQYLGNLNWRTTTDPDSVHEKLLDVTRLGNLGTFSVGHGTVGVTGESGGVMNVPITLTRSSTFFERVRLSVTDLPTGWSAPLASTSLMGWTANATTMRVTIPPRTPHGRYDLRIIATNQGRTDTIDVPIQVTYDSPTAKPPVAAFKYGARLGSTAVDIRVTWPAATDPSSTIAGYEMQTSVDGGAWGSTVSTSPKVREITRVGLARWYELSLPGSRPGQRRQLECLGRGGAAHAAVHRR